MENQDFLVEQYQGVDIMCSPAGYYAWIGTTRIGTYEAREDVRQRINDFMDSDDHLGWEQA